MAKKKTLRFFLLLVFLASSVQSRPRFRTVEGERAISGHPTLIEYYEQQPQAEPDVKFEAELVNSDYECFCWRLPIVPSVEISQKSIEGDATAGGWPVLYFPQNTDETLTCRCHVKSEPRMIAFKDGLPPFVD